MAFVDKFLGAVGTTTGRAVGIVLACALLLGGAYALYRASSLGPVPDGTDVTEVAPGLPPVFDAPTIARPGPAGGWLTEEVPGDFGATLTIDLSENGLPEDSTSENGSADSVSTGYVSIGLRRGAEQFFPELPGKRKLPLEAEVIAPSEGEAALPKERMRIKAQPQPIIAFDFQAELGLSASVGGPQNGPQVGGAAAVTGARAFGVRLGAVAAAAPSGPGARLYGGPYASIRVYGPLGVGVGKDVLSAPLSRAEGLVLTITTDLPF